MLASQQLAFTAGTAFADMTSTHGINTQNTATGMLAWQLNEVTVKIKLVCVQTGASDTSEV
jgi:hypothetical protein